MATSQSDVYLLTHLFYHFSQVPLMHQFREGMDKMVEDPRQSPCFHGTCFYFVSELYLEIIPGELKGPYRMPGIKHRLTVCNLYPACSTVDPELIILDESHPKLLKTFQ